MDSQKPWAASEFGNSSIFDKRIRNRLVKIAEDLSKAPLAPINQACEDWASTKAAYRFFKNDHVTADSIVSQHISNTTERAKNHNLIFAMQDTSIIDYSSHTKAKGLGTIGAREHCKGLLMHTTLAWSPSNIPLGLLSQKIISRAEKSSDSEKIRHRNLPTEEKESYKWIDALEKTVEHTPEGCRVITICDREGDFYDMFLSASDLETDLVIRACQDRKIEVDGNVTRLFLHISSLPIQQELEVIVPLKEKILRNRGSGSNREVTKLVIDEHGNKSRVAKVGIKFGKITILPPTGKGATVKEKISIYVVQALEIDPPEDYAPIEWNVLTTLNILDIEEAKTIIKIYQLRWKIECYFKVLKSGCKVEDCRLETAERLKKYVALLSIVAWRLYWISFWDNLDSEVSASTVLTELEWKTLYAVINKTTVVPQVVPSLHEAVIWIARLGGYLNRNNDGKPGPTVIWRGWTRLQDMVLIARLSNYS